MKKQVKSVAELHECVEHIRDLIERHIESDRNEHQAVLERIDRLANAVTTHASDTKYALQIAGDLQVLMGTVSEKVDRGIKQRDEMLSGLKLIHAMMVRMIPGE